MLVVNADDFGYNAMTNQAILRSFRLGLCSSATVMANMEGFEEACELIHAHGLVEHVGLHLNLSEGLPLTAPLRRCPRFCDRSGHFQMQRRVRVLRLNRAERDAVAIEAWAQIQRMRAHGLRITHLDSHKNLHEEWGIAAMLVPLMKQANIPFLRPARNIGRPTTVLKTIYRGMFNRWLRRQGVMRTSFFGSLKDYAHARTRPDSDVVAHSCEIMVHPVLDHEDNLVDLVTQQALEPTVRQIGEVSQSLSYSGHRYESLIG